MQLKLLDPTTVTQHFRNNNKNTTSLFPFGPTNLKTNNDYWARLISSKSREVRIKPFKATLV